MLNKKIEAALNSQLEIEAFSSQYYLSIDCAELEAGKNDLSDKRVRRKQSVTIPDYEGWPYEAESKAQE